MDIDKMHKNLVKIARVVPDISMGRKPLPGDTRCGLSSTCWRRTEPRTQATCTKSGKDRACGSGDILADRHTHRQTYSSQYFATAPAGEVINTVIF